MSIGLHVFFMYLVLCICIVIVHCVMHLFDDSVYLIVMFVERGRFGEKDKRGFS